MKKVVLLLFTSLIAIQLQAQNFKLLVGTYTNKGTSEGIYVYDYLANTAETQLLSVTKTVNPSYLALNNDKNLIFAVNEDGNNSTVSSFNFDQKDGKLKLVAQTPAQGADPCFVISNSNRVTIANYSGGNIVTFYTNRYGEFLAAKQVVQHTGKSIHPTRQASSHVHQVLLTPDKKYLVSTDLGEDKIYVYSFAKTHGSELILKRTLSTNPGSGPRHLTFSPNGKFAYLAHEFNGKITAFKYKDGNLVNIQEVETTAKNFSGKIDGADIHVSADGKFLYETNRGDANTISVFSILPNGTLNLVEIVSTLGKGPRNFVIDPTGNHLLVAHQYTNDVVIFSRDQTTGKLTDSGKRIMVGAPVCLVFPK